MATPYFGIDDYSVYFDPKQYLENCFAFNIHGDKPFDQYYQQAVTQVHKLFEKHDCGERLLDIGSGPALWQVMSASSKYKNITMTDPILANREELELFKTNDDKCFDWGNFFELVGQLEGLKNDGSSIVKQRLQSCLQDIVFIDILKSSPLAPFQPEPFDCITSTLCLEASSKDLVTYGQAVRNMVSLLKPAGRIFLITVLNQSYYEFGGKRFFSLSLRKQNVITCFENAGCSILSFEMVTIDVADFDEYADLTGVAIMEAVKK